MEPYVIGVAGPTGSGKTTIARTLAGAAGGRAVLLQHDSYYRDRSHLPFEERCRLNFDHPDALETELLVAHLRALRQGRAVDVPIYDFRTHERLPKTRRVEPAEIVVVEGILVLAEPELRKLCDLKIYVDTDADIRVFRRIRRDLEERGRTFESIRDQYYATVRPMTLQFVEPSRRYADVIVPEGGKNEVAMDLLVSKLRSVLDANDRR